MVDSKTENRSGLTDEAFYLLLITDSGHMILSLSYVRKSALKIVQSSYLEQCYLYECLKVRLEQK